MQKNNFKNKNILIAGGTGMVGQALVPKLKKYGARIYIASMDSKHLSPKGIKKFYKQKENLLKETQQFKMNLDFGNANLFQIPFQGILRLSVLAFLGFYGDKNLQKALNFKKLEKYSIAYQYNF